jgi:hypothetical protein
MKELIEDYKRRLDTANNMIRENSSNHKNKNEAQIDLIRLTTKASEYRTIIIELERKELIYAKEKQELLDCIVNLMAVIDTPVGRRHNQSQLADETRKIGREIIENNKSILPF